MTTITKKTTLLARPVPTLTKVYPTNEPTKVGIVAHAAPVTLEGTDLDKTSSVAVDYIDRDDMPQEDVHILSDECLHEATSIKINGVGWTETSQCFKPGSAVTFKVTGPAGTVTINATAETE